MAERVNKKEFLMYRCIQCRTPKIIDRATYERKKRETGKYPETCSVGCAHAQRRFVTMMRKEVNQHPNGRGL